jgi:hypothetical protein
MSQWPISAAQFHSIYTVAELGAACAPHVNVLLHAVTFSVIAILRN